MIVIALPLSCSSRTPPRDRRRRRVGRPAGGRAGHAPAGAALAERRRHRGARIWTDWTFPLLLVGSMCSIGAVGGTMQNLKLFLSLDKALAQGDVAGVLSLVLSAASPAACSWAWLADASRRST